VARRGEAFAGLDNPWLTIVRTSVNSEKLAALLERNDAYLCLGQHTHLLTDLADMSTAHPLDQRLAAQHMLALYRCNRTADALTRYHHTQNHLAEELGVDPGPTLRQLHEQILRNDPYLRPATPRPIPAGPPTPRQLPAPGPHFVGRPAELHHLTALLDTTRDNNTNAIGGTLVISAIGGTGRIGKTWLARSGRAHPGGAWWIHAPPFEENDTRALRIGNIVSEPAVPLPH
jgi:hypothetical protein